MAFFRRIYRIIALFCWFFYTGSYAFFYIRGKWENTRKVSLIARLWGSGIARIIGLNIKIHGDASTFKGGLIVSNHTGYIDIITHAASFPLRFTPKADIAKWPFLGWFLALNHPIWIDRGSRRSAKKTLDEFKETMAHDIPLIVYPEGTSTDGNEILKFKPTLFEATVNSDIPILPVLTRYKQPEGSPTVCWYGDMSLIPHVWQILGRKRIDAELYLLAPVYPGQKSRKELAEHVYSIMNDKFKEIRLSTSQK